MEKEQDNRAYAQWVKINIHAVNTDLTIKNASLSYGKFHDPNDKGKEYPVSKINGQVIKSGTSYTIASCGRANASMGTCGSITIFAGNTEIALYRWDCPWGSKHNTDSLSLKNNQYAVYQQGGNYYGGALGNIEITVLKY